MAKKQPKEPYKVYGEVKRHEKRTITKKVTDGIGEHATTRIVEEDVYVLTILGNSGEHVRLQKNAPFDSVVGSSAIITIKEGQSTLGDHEEEK